MGIWDVLNGGAAKRAVCLDYALRNVILPLRCAGEKRAEQQLSCH